MRRCALCDQEYDDAYDGCPFCAKKTASAVLPSGSLYGALGGTLGFIALAVLSVMLTNGSTVGALFAPAAFGIAIGVDASQIVARDRKVDGVLGTSPVGWGALVFLLAIVGVPLYFYQRPRIIAVYAKNPGTPAPKRDFWNDPD
ncbi:MAG: hypothetical protein AB2L09_12380 [Coriobacteriia bacterium]